MGPKGSAGFDSSILRAYDVRGVVGETLFEEDFYWLGIILGRKLRARLSGGNPTIAVGYDGRLTSEDFAHHLCDGLVKSGVRVLQVGCGPTPLISFAHYHLKTDGCLMITGSHNPASFNGLKITFNFAPFYGEEIKQLQGERLSLERAPLEVIPGGRKDIHDVTQAYEDRVLRDMVFTKPLKVVWDTGNGAMGKVLERVAKTLSDRKVVESILLNSEIDGTFPSHHPDPTVAANLQQVIEAVKSSQADVGVAFDGDGDRLGVVDGSGRIVWGDQLMIIFAKDILAKHPGAPIIADVKASGILFDKIREMGGHPIMEKTGHSHIKAALAIHNAPLAGELSGHMFFKDRYYGYDDALYAALRLLEILSNTSQDLHTMMQDLPQSFSSPEIRWCCKLGEKEVFIETVKKNLQTDQVDYNDKDGVRVSRDYGWWGIRVSNTEEAITLRLEGYSQADFARIEEDLRRFLPSEWRHRPL